ncbi:MAG: S1 RNA-binding domain-containing protein [Syntrophomonadaceae bacterium]|jgi:S1 RNA binding domain protein
MLIEQSNIVLGDVVEGKVQGITKFGAFIELPSGAVGLVHISEIADTYVKDVKDFIKEGDVVKVKILNQDGKKIGLSIKQAKAKEDKPVRTVPVRNRDIEKHGMNLPSNKGVVNELSLDDKIAKFLKESDERMQPLKNRIEPKKRNRYV